MQLTGSMFMSHAQSVDVLDTRHPASKFKVAVRVLCEFTAKRGDLDMRFTPAPSAEEGLAGHRVIASRRGAHYLKELTLAGDYGLLHIRGRADGYDPYLNQLEEFKTYRGELNRMPANHRTSHWAQLRIYGWLLCQQRGLRNIRLALVYFNIASAEETVLVEEQSAHALEQHFIEHCQRFVNWAESESSHRQARDCALSTLRFPYAQFQGGQRELAEAVYRAVRGGHCLLAQAPTGIGKTIGTIFPALKAMKPERLDKIFFLVAKTSGRRLALDALRGLKGNAAALPLRVVELVARKKACEYPGTACDGSVCPLARGFYDRLAGARAAAMRLEFLDQPTVRRLALAHAICPYYFGQELARWGDVVVGDYNYYFDRSAMLYGWTVADEWRVCVQVDEAHNLIERARKMYSATLERSVFDEARRNAPVALKKSLTAVNRAWNRIVKKQSTAYCVYDRLPALLLCALQEFITRVADYLSVASSGGEDNFQQFFFEAVRFCRLAAEFDSATLFEITKAGGADSAHTRTLHSTLCLRNVVPRRFLAPRFAAAHATVLFSATLTPHDFFIDVLGLQKGTVRLDVGSPFCPDQLTVKLVRSISTRYRDRDQSLAPIVELIAHQYTGQPGNYLAFFSSFEYLNGVAALIEARHPAIPIWKQARDMEEHERECFLGRFVAEGRAVGFAVLGGAFAEGIDLPGSRLIGAFIATLGLPPSSAANEQTQRRMSAIFGSGFEYTYLYPGIQKVVQAAGRVIRGPSDRGVLYLIDDRFGRADIRRLLPAWWQISQTALPSCS